MKNLEKYLSPSMIVGLIIYEKKVVSFEQLMESVPKDRRDCFSELWLKQQISTLDDAGIIESTWMKGDGKLANKNGKWTRWLNISPRSKKTMEELCELVHPKHLSK
jgi:hypothetical protein